MFQLKKVILVLIAVLLCGYGGQRAFAQTTSNSVLYFPLIGLTSVPEPLALPNGAGPVTYHYAVKNFLREVGLSDVHVVDDTCSPIQFVEGDDNSNSLLDYSETWRFVCTTTLSETTQSIATAEGTANNITAKHSAYATVVVGSNNPPPLVSIVNITKVAYPLSLPAEGGKITFTYRVNNPGIVPLSNVIVTDDKCSAMSGKLGDTNVNNLLDVNEVWIYRCTTNLQKTTTNTVHVTAFANGLKAVGEATISVTVAAPAVASPTLGFPNVGKVGASINIKIIAWLILLGILVALIVFFVLTRKKKTGKKKQKKFPSVKLFAILISVVGVVGAGSYALSLVVSRPNSQGAASTATDQLFGWKFPVAKFPSTGPGDAQLAYSDIRDPGGIPQGLPVRLKIPVIGVDSAIEDALITPDGRMDVPAGSVNVAWFSLGPHPGQEGSAVIGGHFGISKGVPFVFYNLDKLKEGDKIYIEDDKGDTLAFIVRSIGSFDRNADATSVFTSQDGLAHLNLITCEGIWNQVNDSYPERRVVFTDALPAEEAVIIPPKPIVTAPVVAPPRSLSIGSRGADVTALQKALVQKNFLKMPRGVAMGYFGALTRTAVAAYQKSVGLPASGVYNALTRAKLMPEKTPVVAGKPTLPSTAITTATDTPAPSEVPLLTADSPRKASLLRDIFITVLLVLSIVFMIVKIIRR